MTGTRRRSTPAWRPPLRVVGPGDPEGTGAPARGETLDLDGASSTGYTTALYQRVEDAYAVEYPRLVRLLTLYCGDRETAYDLAQDTMARGCAHWASVSRMDDQRAWFTRVALNLANSRWRRLVLERTRLHSLPRPLASQDPDLAVSLTVRAALASLTPRQRMAVVLRFYDDLDLAATASVMRCSTGTVKKLTARGLAALRLLLEFDDPEAGR